MNSIVSYLAFIIKLLKLLKSRASRTFLLLNSRVQIALLLLNSIVSIIMYINNNKYASRGAGKDDKKPQRATSSFVFPWGPTTAHKGPWRATRGCGVRGRIRVKR